MTSTKNQKTNNVNSDSAEPAEDVSFLVLTLSSYALKFSLKGVKSPGRILMIHKLWFILISEVLAANRNLCVSVVWIRSAALSRTGSPEEHSTPKKDPDASDALCGVKYALNQHIKSIHCGESSQTLNYLKGKEIFHLCHSELLSRALHGKTSSLCNGFKTNYTTQIQYCL